MKDIELHYVSFYCLANTGAWNSGFLCLFVHFFALHLSLANPWVLTCSFSPHICIVRKHCLLNHIHLTATSMKLHCYHLWSYTRWYQQPNCLFLSQLATHHLLYNLPRFLRMGSVLAASSPNPAPPASGGAPAPGLTVPPGFGMPPVSSVLPQTGVTSVLQQDTENPLPNPGAFDECHRKCKGKWVRLSMFKKIRKCSVGCCHVSHRLEYSVVCDSSVFVRTNEKQKLFSSIGWELILFYWYLCHDQFRLSVRLFIQLLILIWVPSLS